MGTAASKSIPSMRTTLTASDGKSRPFDADTRNVEGALMLFVHQLNKRCAQRDGRGFRCARAGRRAGWTFWDEHDLSNTWRPRLAAGVTGTIVFTEPNTSNVLITK